jgi:metal-sulfur cluster biosynthetic enzyme
MRRRRRGGRAHYTGQVVSAEDVQDALTNVIDPELGLDFVELGLIYDVEIEGSDVHVTFTLTSPGCPIGPQVSEQIEEFVSELEGVESVRSTMVFTPAWTPERMSEDAKFALGY